MTKADVCPQVVVSQWLPWSDLMAFGLGKLRLSPDQFWLMSLRELDTAIIGNLGSSAHLSKPTRNRFAALMASYPDK